MVYLSRIQLINAGFRANKTIGFFINYWKKEKNYLESLSIGSVTSTFPVIKRLTNQAFLRILNWDKKIFVVWCIDKIWIFPSYGCQIQKKNVFGIFGFSLLKKDYICSFYYVVLQVSQVQKLFQPLVSYLAWKVFCSKCQHLSSVYWTKHNVCILNIFSRRCRRK